MNSARRPGRLALAGAMLVTLLVTACGGPASGPPDSSGPTSEAAGRVATTPGVDCSGRGTVEHVGFEESSQGAQGDYQVYLPPCYADNPAIRYPVVYLLHGAGEDDTYWLQVGMDAAADRAIAQGEIAPMILVLPDGGPGFGPGRDGVTFDRYLVDELVPRIDDSYRTVATRGGRAIGGISLGGGRALATAAEAPTMFAAVGGHSPALNNEAALASQLSGADMRVWLDVGEGDYLRAGTVDLAEQMSAAGGDVRLQVSEGAHDRSYWRAHLGEYLSFYDESFRSVG